MPLCHLLMDRRYYWRHLLLIFLQLYFSCSPWQLIFPSYNEKWNVSFSSPFPMTTLPPPFPPPPFLVGRLINNVFITITLAIDFRFPDIQAKVVPLMKDYLLALRSKDDTPSPLLMTSRTSEEDVLDSFKAEIVAKQAGKIDFLFLFCFVLFWVFD